MRSSPLIEYSSTVLILCLWLGAITTVFSSLIGLFQQDIKKVIAYSTMSQLARIYNKIIIIIYRIQAICVKFILLRMNNSQVTKAHNYLNNYISNKRFNSHLSQYFYILRFIISILEQRKPITISRLVDTSETIRLILNLISFFNPLIIYIYGVTFIPSYERSWFYIVLIISFCLHIIFILCFNLPYLKLYSDKRIAQPLRKSWVRTWFYPASRMRSDGRAKPALRIKGASRPRSIFLPLVQEKIRRYYSSYVIPLGKTTDPRAPLGALGSTPLRGVDPFFEWLAGVIDGVGNFNLTKKGIARLTIIMDIQDKKALFNIRHKFGGSIRTIAKKNALKYQISHKKGLIALLEAVNGLIRNPSKLLQMNKLCVKYNIKLLYPKPLTFNNGWLSGFIDSEGSVCFNEDSGQVIIGINQKNKYLLDPLQILYGGRIKIHNSKTEAFKYIIYRKNELFNLIDNYFIKYPLKTKKLNRIKLIKEFYLKWTSKNNKDVIKLNEWVKFKDKWDKFQDSSILNLKGPERKSGRVLLPIKTGLVASHFVESKNQNSRVGVRFYSVSSSEKVNLYDEIFVTNWRVGDLRKLLV